MSRAMKDSGIPWIGEIPKEWKTEKFKHVFRIKKVLAGKLGYDVLSVTQKGLRVKDITSNEGQVASDYTNYQRVHPNDFVMNHMDLITGYVDVAKQEGVTSPDYRTFYSINADSTNNQYYLYIFQFCYKTRLFYNLGQGVSQFGRWRLPAEQQNEFVIPVPSFSEQQRIAEFLDRKCGEIDEAIALQEEFIEELKAYKQSVITEAVTRGLNPNVKFKDSGIDWIGKIPQGWEVVQLKRYARVNNGKEVPVELSADDENAKPVYGSGGVFKYTNEIMYSGEAVMFGRKGTLGKPLYVNDSFWVVDTMYFLTYPNKLFPKYSYYQLSAFDWNPFITQTAIPSIVASDVIAAFICVPPLTEQRQIADYLDTKCAEIDSLIAIKQQKIEELKDYKKSVIYEYVSGKKEAYV